MSMKDFQGRFASGSLRSPPLDVNEIGVEFMQPSRIWIYLVAVLSMALLTACIGVSSTVSGPPTAPAPTATTQAAATLAVEATVAPADTPVLDTPTPEAVAEAVDWTTTASVDGDYYVLGNPNAPIRLIDFSDFL